MTEEEDCSHLEEEDCSHLHIEEMCEPCANTNTNIINNHTNTDTSIDNHSNNDEHNHFGLVHEARHQIEDQGLLQWVLISEVLMHHVVKTLILNARLDVSPYEMGSYSISIVPTSQAYS